MTEAPDNEAKLDRLLKHPRVRKFFQRETKLDRRGRIPFLAGYSTDGKTIFIDSSMPRSFNYRGRQVKTDAFLIVHEELEKALIDGLGWEYLGAHRIAIVAERRAVKAAGVDWDDYDKFMQGEIKRIRALPVQNVPLNLDLAPYKLEPALLEKIVATRGRRPAAVDRTLRKKPETTVEANPSTPSSANTTKAPQTGPSSSHPNRAKWFSIR